jgi:archaellum component FlaC
MKKIVLFLLLSVTLLSSGCAPKAASAPENSMDFAVQKSEGQNLPAPMMEAAPPAMPVEEQAAGGAYQASIPQAVERIVIKNANLSIVVEDPANVMNSVTRMTEDMGGFVVTSELHKIKTSEGLEVPEANITIRVPAGKLTEAMDQIKSMVKDLKTDILSENISGQDVTKEYTDLKSRLTNLENARKQLEKIMEEAVKTEDVLNVYTQLTQVSEQIEVIKGQIKYYEESSAFSAISIYIQSEESIAPLTIGGWKPEGVASNAVQALINMLKFLASVAIWLIIFLLPLGLVIFLPFFLLWKIFRRWKAKQKTNQKINSEKSVKDS